MTFEKIELTFQYGSGVEQIIISTLGNHVFQYFEIITTIEDGKVKIKVHFPLTPQLPLHFLTASIWYNFTYNNKQQLLVNGYQGWSASYYASPYSPPFVLPQLLAPFTKWYGDYVFDNVQKSKFLHSWDHIFIIDQSSDWILKSSKDALFFYWFDIDSTRNHTIVNVDIEGFEANKDFVLFDFDIANGPIEKLKEKYFPKLEIIKKIVGWNTWYINKEKITESIFLNEMQAARASNLPIDVMQLDDGYQRKTGDWLEFAAGFKNGLDTIIATGNTNKQRIGLWLAPFIATKCSNLFKHHPDYFLTNNKGKLVKAGYNIAWGGFFYVLNIENPKVRTHIKNILIHYSKLGISFFKLDFIYAVCVQPAAGQSRKQLLCAAIQLVNECIGQHQIIWCGAPICNNYPTDNYFRIGPDNDSTWDNIFQKQLLNNERPSTKNGIINAISRSHLNQSYFLNDTDVYFFEKNTALNHNQSVALMTIVSLFSQVIMSSMSIHEYQKKYHRFFETQFFDTLTRIIEFSYIDGLYKIKFITHVAEYVLFVNVCDKNCTIVNENNLVFSSTTKSFYFLNDSHSVAKHSIEIWQLIDTTQVQIAGSNTHVLPSYEVENYTFKKNMLQIEFKEKCLYPFTLYVSVPIECKQIMINNKIYLANHNKIANIVTYCSN